jgi:hypothetical protein
MSTFQSILKQYGTTTVQNAYQRVLDERDKQANTIITPTPTSFGFSSPDLPQPEPTEPEPTPSDYSYYTGRRLAPDVPLPTTKPNPYMSQPSRSSGRTLHTVTYQKSPTPPTQAEIDSVSNKIETLQNQLSNTTNKAAQMVLRERIRVLQQVISVYSPSYVDTPNPPSTFTEQSIKQYIIDLNTYKMNIVNNQNITNKTEVIDNINKQISNLLAIENGLRSLKNKPEQYEIFSNFLSHIDTNTGEIQWDEIPIEDWKFYEGGDKRLAELSEDERLNAIGGNKKVDEVFNKLSQYYSPTSILMGPLDSRRYQIAAQYGPTFLDRVFRYANTLQGKVPEGRELATAIAEVLWEDISVINPNETKYYSSLGFVERNVFSLMQSARQFFIGSFAFPEVISQKVLGSSLSELPYVSAVPGVKQYSGAVKGYMGWEQKTSAGPSGVLSYGSSFIPILGSTPEEREQQKQVMFKYPVESVFATGGELIGLYGSTKTSHMLKVGFNKAFQFATLKTLGKTYLPSAFGSISVLRGIKYRLQGITKVSPETVFRESTLLKTTEATKYGQVPFKQGISEFKSSLNAVEPKYYTIVHTSPQPIGALGKIGYAGKRFKAGGSTSESPGISTSPYGKAIPQFLKLEPSLSSSYRLSILPKLKLPSITEFMSKRIVRLPKEYRGYESSSKLMNKTPKGSYSVIAPKMEIGKFSLVEPESIIWKGTKGIKKGNIVSYTSYKGVTVPIRRYMLKELGQLKLKGFTSIDKATKNLSGVIKETKPTISVPISTLSLKSIPSLSYKSYPSKYSTYPSYSLDKYSVSSIPSYKSSYEPSYSSYTSSSSKSSYSSLPSYPSYKSYKSSKSSYKSSYRKSSGSYKSSISKSLPPYYPSQSTSTTKAKESYNTFVKNPNTKHYERITENPLEKKQALGIGADRVDKTTATEFEVRKTKRKPSSNPLFESTWSNIGYKFSGKGNTYTEKPPYRADYDIEKKKYRNTKTYKPLVYNLGGKK